MLARTVGRVNSALMLHARADLRLSEIARASDLPRQIVASAVATLEKKGLARRSRVGAHDVFEADTSSPYYPAAYLVALVDLPVAEVLDRHRALACWVYGSLATPGAARPRSDLDLMLVGDFADKAAVRAALSTIGERLERRVDAFLLSPEEFEEGMRLGDPRVREGLGGVRVFGEV